MRRPVRARQALWAGRRARSGHADGRALPPSCSSLRGCPWAPTSGRSPSLWKEVSAFPGGRLPEQALLSGGQSQLPAIAEHFGSNTLSSVLQEAGDGGADQPEGRPAGTLPTVPGRAASLRPTAGP